MSLLLVASLAAAPWAQADITGSAHDFSMTAWAGGQICRPCHTPHASNSATAAPLWNHQISTATYALYSSPTMNPAYPPQQPGPGGMSRLCLSCHDGTVALDAFSGATGATMMPASSVLGTNLANDHPIGMEWRHQTGPPSPSCANCHDLHAGMRNPGPVYFVNRRVECTSCHDVHNTRNLPKLLVKTQIGSSLCLHCHNK